LQGQLCEGKIVGRQKTRQQLGVTKRHVQNCLLQIRQPEATEQKALFSASDLNKRRRTAPDFGLN
jgi:hypothetical protein